MGGKMPKAYIKAWKAANPDKVKAARERERIKRALHPDEDRAKGRAYHQKNREAILGRRRKKIEADPEGYFASAVAWRRENREYARAQSQAWREANRVRARAANKVWREANREKCRVMYKAKKLKRRRELIAFLTKVQKAKCAYCRENLVARHIHVDHIMPRALGGTNARSNLQLTCDVCNLSKNARHPIEYAQSLGRLI